MKNLHAFALASLLLLSAAFATAQVSSPIDVQYMNYHQFTSDHRFFHTDIYGYPTMRFVYGPSGVILSPSGANRNDLPNNAVLCPGTLSAVLDVSNVAWAHTFYNGSSTFATALFPSRPYPNALSGSNPISSNVPIVANSSFALELDGSPITSIDIRRSDPNNIWNRLDAVTTTDQNSRYWRTYFPPNYINSSASKTTLICRGKVMINGTAVQDISNTQTSVTLISNPGSVTPGSTISANAGIRLDKCVGVIHSLQDNDPIGTSSSDRMYLFKVQGFATFPTYSGTANMSVTFQNPTCVISVSGSPFGPFQLNISNSTSFSIQVTNAATTILPVNITGVSQAPGNPANSVTATLVSSPNNTILPGATNTLQIRITQGSPPFNGTLNFLLTGQTIGNGCSGSPLLCNATVPNVIVHNWSAPSGGGTTISYVCVLNPNPVPLSTDPVAVRASCIKITNGTPSAVTCPPFTWTKTNSNLTINPTTTGAALNPQVTVNYTGFVQGGYIQASNGTLTCNATLSCAQLTCELSSNLTNNIIVPPQTMRLMAQCINTTSPTAKCPGLNWYTNLTNVTLEKASTPTTFFPSNQLFTSSATPAQNGTVWADSNNYCRFITCTFPPSAGGNNTPITIVNKTCLMPCNVSSLQQNTMLYSGLIMHWNATCYNRDPLTGAITGQVPCPLSWWRSDAGNFSPNITSPPPASPWSDLNVTNVSGTYVRINYSDNHGTPCHCNATLLHALPDYVPEEINRIPAGPIQLGNTVQLFFSTKNIGAVMATNNTITTLTLPKGGTQYDMPIGLLDVLQYSAPSGPFNYTCITAGIKEYEIEANSLRQMPESNYLNNMVNGTINCGNVLVCADYI